ncbi:MAG: alpha/beta hydrolase [Cyclobacteriaceae bacterium]
MDKTNHILRWGTQGKPLVLLHYFGGSASSWQWVAEALQNDYQCIALNLPGFGQTAPLTNIQIETFAEWIANMLTQLDLSSCTLIGHSMSGKLALEVAARDSATIIDQLILIAPSPPTREPMPEEEKQRMLHHPDRKEAEKTVEQATIKPLSNEQRALAIDTQLVIDHATWRWWLLEGMNHAIADHLSLIKAPISVLASTKDPAIPYDAILNDVIGLLPQTQLISTDQTGHLLPLEDPDWVAQQIRRIIDGPAS